MKFISAFRKLVLILFLSASTAVPAFAQNIVSGNIESVPFQAGVDSAEVILTNTSTLKHYAALTDSLGNFSLSVPTGSYSTMVKAVNFILYNDSVLTARTINGTYDSLDIQLIQNIQLDPDYAKYYNNAWEMFMNMIGVPYGQHTWSGIIKNFGPNLSAFLDSAAAPAGWAAWADSAASDITRGSLGKINWHIQSSQVTSNGGNMDYVPNNQMPVPGYAGWTKITKDSNNNPIVATWWINTTFSISDTTLKIVDEREMLRTYGFVGSPVDSSWWNENGTWSYNLNRCDGYAAAIAATIPYGTNIAAYPDSVITSTDLPPTKPILDSPVTGDSLKPGPATFTWTGKPGSHGVTYTFKILGTSITKTTTDTTFTIDSTTVLNLKGLTKYSWTVIASDSLYTIPADTLSFIAIPLPAVVKSHSSISFGTVHADSTALDSIRVTNSSTIPLVIDSIYTATKWFSTISLHDTLTNTDTLTIPITFSPDTSRAYTDTLYIASNGKIPLIKIPLSGNGTLTAVQSASSSVPTVFGLEQNYPNPFNPTTVITYDVANPSFVTLKVYNVLGQQVATLVNAEKSPGEYQATFNGSGLPSGVYFYRIQAGNYTDVKKLMLVK